MENHPQDAEPRAVSAPQRVRHEGKKILAAEGGTVAAWFDAALVGDDTMFDTLLGGVADTTTGGALACWSGSPAATPDDLFPDDPSVWTPGAWAALDEALGRLAPALAERGLTLLLRPHHRHVVGDVPSVGRLLRLLDERGLTGVAVLLDAESMLADSMRARDADDHIRRIREALRAVARCEIV